MIQTSQLTKTQVVGNIIKITEGKSVLFNTIINNRLIFTK